MRIQKILQTGGEVNLIINNDDDSKIEEEILTHATTLNEINDTFFLSSKKESNSQLKHRRNEGKSRKMANIQAILYEMN